MMAAKSEETVRATEKVLALLVVLAALCLAVLIAVIDGPPKETGSAVCDQANCLLHACIQHFWNLWPSW